MKYAMIKIDINFLDKPLYFQNLRCTKVGFIWNDIEGYIYRSGYFPPDHVDMLVLLFLMLKSQREGFKNQIVLSRYEILKECGFSKDHMQYYNRLEESLRRWSNVTIEFHGIFYDGKSYISQFFHIMKASISQETKKVEVVFDPEWLLKIKESQFFKYINFERYKALKRPISRRLYEILCHKFKGRDEWEIHLVKLGEKLTISKRVVHTREGKKEVLYASDVLVAIKPAINEVNRQAETPDIGKKLGMPPEDIFTIEYKIRGKKQDRIITFRKHLVKTSSSATCVKPAKKVPTSIAKAEVQLISPMPSTPRPKPDISHKAEEETTIQIQAIYQATLQWLDTISHFHQKRKEEIAAMPMEYVANRYPSIRHQYEKLSKTAKKPSPGWVYSAFKNQFIFPEDIKQAKKKEQEAERKAVEAHTQEVKNFIQEKGGIRNLLYGNKKITSEHLEYGLTLKSDNGAEGGVLWKNVKVEDFTVKE